MGIREDQKKQRRDQIISVAIDLFVTKGYAATKITDIAEKASMSTGLLFHYFKNKEALYKEIVELGLHGTQMGKNYNDCKAIDCFQNFLIDLLDYMQKQPIIAKIFVLMSEAKRNGSTPQEIRDIASKVNTVYEFAKIAEKGQEEGDIKDGDPLALSNAFWCAVQGVAEQNAAHPEIPLPKAEWLVDIIRK